MPNSRLVRAIMAHDADRWQKDTTMLLMQFGQFVDHDITHVPVFQLGISLNSLDYFVHCRPKILKIFFFFLFVFDSKF